MIKSILLGLVTVLMMSSFSGCAIKNIREANNFSEAVSSVSEEFNRNVYAAEKRKTIILTSMVDVNNFRQSSDFGRLYSDSLLTNLKRSGWNIIDYRGKNLLTKSKNGEFYLSRKKLKDLPAYYNYVVGTYGVYGEKLVVNVRLLSASNNEVIVASNSIINDGDILKMALINNCNYLSCQNTQKDNFSISVKQDDCKNALRCECSNPDGCTGEGK